jgi:hypothetical protein
MREAASLEVCLARALRVDAHRHGARFAVRNRDRLEAEADIAARNAPVALQLRRDTFDRGGWDDEHPPTRPENRRADRLANRIQREGAFGAPPQAQIKLDPGLDLAAAQRSPGSRGAEVRRNNETLCKAPLLANKTRLFIGPSVAGRALPHRKPSGWSDDYLGLLHGQSVLASGEFLS